MSIWIKARLFYIDGREEKIVVHWPPVAIIKMPSRKPPIQAVAESECPSASVPMLTHELIRDVIWKNPDGTVEEVCYYERKSPISDDA